MRENWFDSVEQLFQQVINLKYTFRKSKFYKINVLNQFDTNMLIYRGTRGSILYDITKLLIIIYIIQRSQKCLNYVVRMFLF